MNPYELTYRELPLLLFEYSPTIMLSFVFSSIIIWKQKNKNDKIYSFFFPQVIIYVSLTFFPLLVVGMKKFFISDTKAYARMNWLYMVIPAVAVAFVIILQELKSFLKIYFIFLFIIFMFCIRPEIFPKKYVAEDVYYKILHTIKGVDDKILEDNKEFLDEDKKNHVKVLYLYSDSSYDEYHKYIYYTQQTRAYTSPIEIYSENTDEFNEKWDSEIFTSEDSISYDYVVSSNDNKYEIEITNNGYKLEMENSEYKLYGR